MGVEALAEVIGITLQNFLFLVREKHISISVISEKFAKNHTCSYRNIFPICFNSFLLG